MKRFYNNTIMSKVSKHTLRVFALLCVLLGISSSAWGATTIYFENTLQWGEVYVCLDAYWKDDYEGVVTAGKTAYKMEYITTNEFGNKIYQYTYTNEINTANIVFIAHNQGNWNQLNNTSACFRGDLNVSKPLFKPNTTKTKRVHDTDYYNDGEWYGAPCFPTETIYFVNNLGWQNVYAYLYSAEYWNDAKGTGSNSIKAGPLEMTKVPGSSNIYTCTYDAGHSGYISFTEKSQPQYEHFYQNNVVHRGDLCSPNNMFVPDKNQTPESKNTENNSTSKYYNKGEWTTFSTNTYSLAGTFNNWSTKANKETVINGYSCTPQDIELVAGTYTFKIVKDEETNRQWYGYNGSITNETETAGLKFDQSGGDCTITAEKDGVYTFTFGENWMDNGNGGKKSGLWLTVTYGQAKEPVLLAYNAEYNSGKTEVTLSAYIQKTYCMDAADNTGGIITDWGFVICPGTATSACTPTITSAKKSPSSRDPKYRGDIFEHTLDFEGENLIGGATYGYRGYVMIAGKMYLTKETGTFFFPGDCTQQEINLSDPSSTPIKYTIDASLGEDYADDCNLRYGSLQEALNRLRALAKDDNVEAKYKYATYDNENRSLNLNAPIEFHVAYYDPNPDDASSAYCYEGDTKAGVSGGGSSSENSYALIIKEINRKKEENRYTLTIKAANEKARPWLHHVIVRESKDVILDNLAIFSDPTNELQDDALEFDCNSKEWHELEVDHINGANIVVKNCLIGSNGFTGVHASAYDGITFENNEFEAIMATTGDIPNAVSWGASAKFMACKNIKFIRNNFRGAHATLVWIQDTQNALFMNNVFWNTNQYKADCSAIRLVEQYNYGPTKNIGFYYNTFYLADGEINKDYRYDFLHTSDKGGNEEGRFSNIEFMYNNCYSYDTDAPGKSSSEPDQLSNSTLCPNNFWSKYDQLKGNTKSVFAFGSCEGESENKMVNVSELVCATTATGPASLVIKAINDGSGKNLNNGILPEISITGQEVDPLEFTYDRYKNARPNDNTWTYGAYQAKMDVEVNTIYWVGVSEKWDDRNNWGFYESGIEQQSKGNSPITRSAELQRLSCVNILSNELKVIIPEKPLVQLDGGRRWPQLPSSFASGTRESESGIPTSEQVTTKDGKKFADNIELEYGAAIKGVEHLVNGQDHYGSATTHFIAPRSEWILVGTIVKPWDEDNPGQIRDMKSGDYYIENRTPNVYIHKVVLEDGNPTWDIPFASLEESLVAGEVFAMMVPDEYGVYKLPFNYYKNLIDRNATFDPKEPIEYGVYPGTKGRFTGRFVNEKPVNQGYPISYNNLSSGPNLLNNSYPYNIDAKEIEKTSKGTIQYYDSEARAFFTTSSTPNDVILKPQHGFVFTPKSGTTKLNIEYGMFNDGNTRSRAAEEELPTFSLNLYNANANSGYSNIAVRMDEFLGEGNQSEMDVEKAFVNLSGTPELYIIAYDSKYSRVDYFSTEQPIPLGVRLKEPMNVRFEKAWFRGFTEATLFDKLTGREYDLLNRTYTTETLQAGDIEGRFFLNLSDTEIYVPEEDDEEEKDTPTFVEDNTEDVSSINIFLRESDNTIRVITSGVELETIYISDMSGKTARYNVSGYFAEINLPVAQGVYMIHVVGDTASRTEKVILK